LGTDYIDFISSIDGPQPAVRGNDAGAGRPGPSGQGKVYRLFELAGWQLMKAMAISDKHNWEKFVAFQGLYSLIARDLEYELAPLCVDQGLGILTWSPLGGGLLSGNNTAADNPDRKGQDSATAAQLLMNRRFTI